MSILWYVQREERSGTKTKKLRKRKGEKEIVQKQGRREMNKDQLRDDQIVRTTFKTDPLFYTLGYLGQIPKKSMCSYSIHDTHAF